MSKEQKKIQDKEKQTNGFEERDKDFQEGVTSRGDVYEMVREALEKATEKNLSDKGIKPVDKYAGVYATGKVYGVGSEEGKYNVTYSDKVKTMIEKSLSIGTKRIESQIYLNFDPKNEKLSVMYDMRNVEFFKKQENPSNQLEDYKLTINTSDKEDLKKGLKSFFERVTKKEIDFVLSTKLAVDDKLETSIRNQQIDENINTMKLTNLLNSSETEITDFFQNKINESLNKLNKKFLKENEEETEKNKERNTVELGGDETLLFDEKDEEKIDEVTTAGVAGVGGSAGSFGYNSPKAFKSGGDLNLGKEDKKDKKDESFYTPVEMNKGGWPPKGMEHPFYQGKHQDNEGASSYPNVKTGNPKMNENKAIDTTKKKFFSEEENKELGINKRYLITDKLNESEQFEKWKRLSLFEENSTFKKAEEILSDEELSLLKECGCQDMPAEDNVFMDRQDAEDYLNDEFEEVNSEDDNLINVERPGSFVILKISKEDLMNEDKKFVYDHNTGNYVLNPNLQESKDNFSLNDTYMKYDDQGEEERNLLSRKKK